MPTNFTLPGLTTTQTAQVAGLSLGLTIANIVFLVVMWVLSCVAIWHCFTRAGEKGWKAIIPFWRQYVMFRIAWKTEQFKSWLIPYLIGIVGAFCYGIFSSQPNMAVVAYIGFAVFVIAYIVSLVFLFKM